MRVLTAHPQEDRDIQAAPQWRWYQRYALAIAIVAVAVWLCLEVVDRNPWIALTVSGGLVVFALIIAKEVGLVVLGLLALGAAWYFTKDFDDATWAVIFAVGAFGYMGYLADQQEKRLQAQIDALQRQINRMWER